MTGAVTVINNLTNGNREEDRHLEATWGKNEAAPMTEMMKEDSDSTQGSVPNGQSCLKGNGLQCGVPLKGVIPGNMRRQADLLL